jgi:predicted TIM-barrel fold metal-dependent hydrolase
VGRIVDIHTHVFPDDVAVRAVPALAEEGGVEAVHAGTVSSLLAEMDRAGIDVSVTQPVSTKPSQVAGINDWAASTASDRIVPFGTIHPDLEGAAEEVGRIASLGLKGFKLHPEYQSFHPDDERMYPVYEAANELGLVILFHAGADIAIPTLRGTPESFVRVLDAHPGLRVVLAHMGGFRQWDGVRESLVGRDVHLDTSYSLGHMDDEEFVGLVHAHGVGRILFGTDGPWADAAEEVRLLRSVGLAEADVDRILGANAVELLGL